MKHLFFSLILSTLFFSLNGFAGHGKLAEINGFVASFDAKTVKIYSEGQFIIVPRSAIVKGSQIVVGNEVTALIEMNRSVASKKGK